MEFSEDDVGDYDDDDDEISGKSRKERLRWNIWKVVHIMPIPAALLHLWMQQVLPPSNYLFYHSFGSSMVQVAVIEDK